MVLGHTYPPDVRIKKEAKSLLAAGHEVSLLCRAREDEPARETVDGIDVVRLTEDSRLDTAGRLASAACNMLVDVHPRWVKALFSLIREKSADVIHVHDLPLVRDGILVGDRMDVPVVADLHENYPEAVRQWRKPHTPASLLRSPMIALHWAFKPTWRYKRIERHRVREVDRLVTVTEEAESHYQRDCAVLPDRTTVVSNTVDLDTFVGDEEPKPGFEDEFVVGYVGTFGAHRGLTTVVEAMADVVDEVPDARFLLAGAGSDPYEEELRETVAAAGVEDHVTFTGWIDFDDFPNYMATCDVCLVPHESTPHTRTTVPHKLFQYMAMERPVLVTDLSPLARVVKDADSGVVAQPGDSDSIARALVELAENPDRTAQYGRNGREAVEDRYNWERTGETLVAMHERLAGLRDA
ncbi:glycosyltransferase family 4 protein [Haloarchaeobius sp. TZWWS8]|uniref:glycosyltransferase family 4 protein n=1 Tax=Haloarchaeobius sp. TZWWS8 TaxID=3446121 RepID=UPI003EBA6F32